MVAKPVEHGDVKTKGPMTPTLIVVGSGRCGTASMAEALDGEHEPFMDPVVYLAMARSHGWLTDDSIAFLLQFRDDWPEVVCDYKQSELIDVSSKVWPDARYLWLVRNPADTVASMVAQHWYLPSDDMYPPGYLNIYWERDGDLLNTAITNDAGNRTRGDMTGHYNRDQWMAMSQVERCGWWWNYCNKTIFEQFQRLDPERALLARLEDAARPGFGSWLVGHEIDFPHVNSSAAKPVYGWEPYVREMADALGF